MNDELQKEINNLKSQITNEFESKIKLLMEKYEKKIQLNPNEISFVKRIKEESYFRIKDYRGKLIVINIYENEFDYDNNTYNQYNYYPTKEIAQSYLDHWILSCKLLQIRDAINGDWKPVWKLDSELKYCIYVENNKIIYGMHRSQSNPLTFKTEKDRDYFRTRITDDEIIKFLSF